MGFVFFFVIVIGAVAVTGSMWPVVAAYVLIGLVFLAGLTLAHRADRDRAHDARHRATVVRR